MIFATSRGDRGEDIFLDDVDRQDFLKTLAEAWQKTGWQVHAYCLTRNHFHLVVDTPNADLVEGILGRDLCGLCGFRSFSVFRALSGL